MADLLQRIWHANAQRDPPSSVVALRAGVAEPAPAAARVTLARTLNLRRVPPELVGLLGVAGVLNLWGLSRNGWANGYYSAAVRSMSLSWHNFLYASFDPSGVMSVDKPPLALWLQVASVKLFGFHSDSILVPEALLGMLSVALIYDLTRRRFGRVAGAAAGLTLALTPITVAISRHNNPDSLLIACCVAALWCSVRALQDGRTRWIVLAGIAVGLGFETKMAVALLVVPGIAIAWLWVAPRGRVAAIRQLLAGGVAMIVVGGAWPTLVALTPAADRPWVSGTKDNSIWSLITEYNGLGRLSGQAGGPEGVGGGGSVFGGSPGPLRLLNSILGGQAGWLLGFALVSGLGVLVLTRLRRRHADTGWLLVVGGAFVTTAAAFSLAKGIFHPYYVSFLAPFSAALVGAGVGQIARKGLHARVLAPLAIGGGLASELVVLHNEATMSWLTPILIVIAVASAAALAFVFDRRVRTVALGAVLLSLSIAPASWAVQTLGYATSATFPTGGPQSTGVGARGVGAGPPGSPGGRGGFGAGPGFGGGPAPSPASPPTGAAKGAGTRPLFSNEARSQAHSPSASNGQLGGLAAVRPGSAGTAFGGNDRALGDAVSYASSHGGGTVAVSSQSAADDEIIEHGALVAGIGGFSGQESQTTVSWFASEVRAGHIRWVLSEGTGSGGGFASGGRIGAREVLDAVAKACERVSDFQAGSSSSAAGADGGESATLYDCSGRVDELLHVG